MDNINKDCIKCISAISDGIKPCNYCYNCKNKNAEKMKKIKIPIKELLKCNC